MEYLIYDFDNNEQAISFSVLKVENKINIVCFNNEEGNLNFANFIQLDTEEFFKIAHLLRQDLEHD